MKNRTLIFLCVAILCFSLGSCAEKVPDPNDLDTMLLQVMDAYEVKLTVSITRADLPLEPQIMEIDLKAKGNDIYMLYNNDMILYTGGIMYMSPDGVLKQKDELSLEQFLAYAPIHKEIVTLPPLTGQNVKIQENGDLRSITVGVDSVWYQDYLVEQFEGLMGSGMETMTISDVSSEITFNEDGYIVKLIYVCSISDGNFSATMQTTFDFVNPGVVPNITAPNDASDYEDFDASIYID